MFLHNVMESVDEKKKEKNVEISFIKYDPEKYFELGRGFDLKFA